MDIVKNMCTKKSFDQYFCKFEGKMFEFYFHLRWFLTITKFVDALELITDNFYTSYQWRGIVLFMIHQQRFYFFRSEKFHESDSIPIQLNFETKRLWNIKNVVTCKTCCWKSYIIWRSRRGNVSTTESLVAEATEDSTAMARLVIDSAVTDKTC